MSKIRKARKLRTPNVPTSFEPTAPVVAAIDRGETRVSEPVSSQFDYSHTMGDLRRIGILAGGFIVVFIALTFIVR